MNLTGFFHMGYHKAALVLEPIWPELATVPHQTRTPSNVSSCQTTHSSFLTLASRHPNRVS